MILLLLLAASDLVVGVSNDAVNFLNSAIGSKVASRQVIMIVASIGIFFGATFSSGMMEIARKGIFNPELFYFSEIIIIFLAVMLTDIFLLDVFNTFGLPTSTTVSIVFELLGAATIVSMIKIMDAGQGMQELSTYLNASSAILIISGIFISIGVAFIVGMIVQYFSRILFSFHIDKRLKFVGGIWSGIALSCLTYFLLFKGIKGASFVSDEMIKWVASNTFLLISTAAIFWFVLMQILVTFFRINVLRFVVLFGTFSLAMAFAGNDLVNFIGVPIAGLESYLAWSGSGLDPEMYTMDILKEPVRTNTLWLLIGGLIMIFTLWFSKKAQTVTETEVNLGRQEASYERFSPNIISRSIVRASLGITKFFEKVIPAKIAQKIDSNFEKHTIIRSYDAPAFDLVRASVNLTVAGVLIAFATSLRLPLSTTYVSFMVAMGTSLADRAWGRSSAVYRIAGVLNVIGGWLMTALIAFFVSGTFALIMIKFGFPAIVLLVALLVIFIFMTYRKHRNALSEKSEREDLEKQAYQLTDDTLMLQLRKNISFSLEEVRNICHLSVRGLLQEDRELLGDTKQQYKSLRKTLRNLKENLYLNIKNGEAIDRQLTHSYILAYDLQQDMLQSIVYIVKSCIDHVDNSHEPFTIEQVRRLEKLEMALSSFLLDLKKSIDGKRLAIRSRKKSFHAEIAAHMQDHIVRIQKQEFQDLNGQLYLGLLLEFKDLVAVAARLVKLYPKDQHKRRKEKDLVA